MYGDQFGEFVCGYWGVVRSARAIVTVVAFLFLNPPNIWNGNGTFQSDGTVVSKIYAQ